MEERTGMFIVAGIILALVVGITVAGVTGFAGYQEQKYKKFAWDCQDGTHWEQTGCRTYSSWISHSRTVCASHCRIEESNGARICNPSHFSPSVKCKTPWFRMSGY